MDGSQNVHHEVFSSHLANYEILLQSGPAVPDDKFEVHNDPICTNIGFSTSALSRGDRLWRKGTKKFYAVNWPSISRDEGQATAQGNHHCQ